MLEIACRHCDRRGRLRVARLIAQHGADMRLTELRYILAADCPRVIADQIYDRCGLHYPQLGRLGLLNQWPVLPQSRPP
jgi:hypothetical protein